MTEARKSNTAEGSSPPSKATTRRLALIGLLLAAAAPACGGRAPNTDPLTSIAAGVAEEDRLPTPLAEAWRRVPPTPLRMAPAVGSAAVYVALDNRLAAWSAGDGSDLWLLPLDSPISAAPLARGGRVVVGTAGGQGIPPRLWWISAAGVVLAQHPLERAAGELAAPAASDAASVFYRDDVGVGRSDLGGEPGWYAELPAPRTITPSGSGSLLYVTTASGGLLGLDGGDGRVRWGHTYEGVELTRPAAGQDRVFVAGSDGHILALREDGSDLWERALATAVEGGPAPTGDLVWVAGLDGRLQGLDAGNGTLLHDFRLPSRNYIDLTTFGAWTIVGARRGPWMAVRAPLRSERRGGQATVSRPPVRTQVTRRADDSDLEIAAATGPIGVAVVNGSAPTSELVLLRPQQTRGR